MLTRFACLAALACASLSMTSTSVEALTRDDVRLATQIFNNKFYNEYGNYADSKKAMLMENTKRDHRQDFWREVEAIETVIDAYDVTRDEEFKTRIKYLYHGFRDGRGLTWEKNEFNDDIIWGVIMAIRAFEIFNDGGMKQMAVDNFEIVWKRGFDNAVGGGLWWKTDKKSKNTCVNAPAAIAAVLLHRATGDAKYKDRAHQLMQWTKEKLLDNGSGEVKGALDASGKITEGGRTYTQGTYIGAAGMLEELYPGEGWLDSAIKATDFAKSKMAGSNGLLPDEYCDGMADCPGFKSIFARWVGYFVRDHKQQSRYASWLEQNAKAAWSVRNSDGLMWAKWGQRTPDNAVITSWEAASGVSMMSSVFFYHNEQKIARMLRAD
ncbi:hypothetical protein Poli38472_013329 [Pythium oligandrum]|uniref:Glycoside hydrolase family 76 n=1 Tax=Pythium oligandrum TaxID=41045 RepID=A0A8K1FC22_PYTOL|nr:hypothetical protein Poli38472_013329 [Pythium oligandrum]|eukprot:TMW57855.1 hypothetical protein Poli38472_013329 [Pythium oligandrum]